LYSAFRSEDTEALEMDHYTALIQAIATLVVDGWTVTFGTARRACGPAQSPPHCTKCNSPPIDG